MSSIKYFYNILIGTLILTLLQFINNIFANADISLNSAGCIFLSSLFTTAVLSLVIIFSKISEWKLMLCIFLIYFGIYHFNVLIEAIFFGLSIPSYILIGIVSSGFLINLFFSIIIVKIFQRMKPEETTETINQSNKLSLSLIWKIPVCVIIYIILYFTAGAIAFQYLQDFYSAHVVPPISDIFFMQIFRGFIYVGISLMIITNLTTSRLVTGIISGLSFSILGAISPLLIPNSFMPAHIRWIHGIEVGISNFIFGIITVFIISNKNRKAENIIME